jgi:hypothetical protein
VRRYENKPFVLLGVNSDTDRQELREAIRKNELNWRSWWDGGREGPIDTAWRIQSWPTMYLIDHKGIIRHAGRPTPSELDQAIAQLVSEAEKDLVN